MKRLVNKRKHDEQDESYFASMTDIMVGLLFVFIIIIMYFAFQLKAQTEQVEQRENYANEATQHREQILNRIRDRLLKQGIKENSVSIDNEQGILRFHDSILFDKGKVDIGEKAALTIAELGSALKEVLRCSVFYEDEFGFNWYDECEEDNPNLVFVASIFIEGHTDNDPIKGGIIDDNWKLSARRATNTYNKLVSFEDSLKSFRSPVDEAIFGASAFGETRPIESNATKEGKAANRRIDMRLIMYVPATGGEVQKFKQEIRKRLQRQ